MKIATTLFLFVVVGCTWRKTASTCVLESDFGFILNCAFKKSGLFRVRNLGGVKGYVGLGFSVGDELGFRESLSNLESSKRRSVQAGRGNFVGSSNGQAIGRNDGRQIQANQAGVVPPFKPLPPGAARPMGVQPERQRLVVQQNSTALRTIPAPTLATMQEEAMKAKQRAQYEAKSRQEALALQMLKQQRLQQQEASRQQQMQKLADQNAQQQLILQNTRMQPMQASGARLPNIVAAIPPKGSVITEPAIPGPIPGPQPVGVIVRESALPPFIAMPKSSSQLTDKIGHSSSTLPEDSVNEVSMDLNPLPIPGEEQVSSVNRLTSMALQPGTGESQYSHHQQTEKRQSIPSSLPSLAPIQSMGTSLKTLAEASNITLEALEAAILLRQQQLMNKQQGPTTTSSTTTTTSTTTQSPAQKTKYSSTGVTKVMNAPREYYPMGYDKNFDDNFASRVDLPDTSFYCGDQKHFPGLYGDEDLGCMVFHVCALTDDGLIMKSFLCPESTLFDQTILKCNWWFYVDCKSSKSLYDSNIPISKSYQLMKALAFFSAYKNHDNGTASSHADTETDTKL